ncbi:hypothetical protein [Paraglaciecola sp. MB-3u-78]|uniref:hypothetical protein n=1 Tax=Paraglaciecola sp. MB-3u-78 TaxID=2058332 RepID=UPI000C33F13E|nr:hypothetical protein [Paraglaciecola sp. MB-3u-78]PKG97109.1 hypothetical protein CXF95_21130 [Paraglaciecola sp. MB-3u-78]
MFNHVFFKILSISLLVSACASNTPTIMTDEKFDSRLTDKGQTEFVYGISWQNTSQESLLRDGRKEIKRPQTDEIFLQERPNRLAMQANNQTKLDLEDQAAQALKRRLVKEQLCAKGYEISNVIWKAESIRLLGYCF